MKVVSSSFILVIFHFFLSISCNQDDESHIDLDFLTIDRTNYVDPHDILNYDRGVNKKTLETPQTIQTKPPVDAISTENVVSNPEKSEATQVVADKTPKFETERPPDDNEINSSYSNSATCPAKERPFLGRFVRILSKTLDLEVSTKLSTFVCLSNTKYFNRTNISMMEILFIFLYWQL